MTLPRIQCALLLSVLLLGSIDYALADTSCQLNPPVISGCGDFSGMPAQVYGGQTVTVSIGPSGTGAPCVGNARGIGINAANGKTWVVDGNPIQSTDISMSSIPLDANPHTVQVTMQGHFITGGPACNLGAFLGVAGVWTTVHYFELDPAITASFTANVTFKSGTGPGVNAGDTITYTATAQNAVPISSWKMASDLPPETTLVPGSITGGGVLSGRTITWTTTLGGYSVTVDPQLPGRTQVATGVFVTATLPNGDTAFAQASTQVPVQQPSLLLEITPTTRTPGEVEPGETYTYTLTLTVPPGATGITLQDAIPQNTTLIQGSATPAAQLSGNVLTWTFPPGTTQATASFQVQLAQANALPPGAQFVVDNANASATAGGRTLTTAATNQLKIQSALTFSINPPPPPAKVAPGGSIDYTLNAAVTTTATTIKITDTIPPGTKLVNAHGGQVSGSTVTWTFQNTGAATAMLSVRVLDAGDLPPGLTSIVDLGHADATLPSGDVLTADATNTVPLEKFQIDWQMKPRLSADLEEGWGALYPYGLPPASYVNPPNWQVTLFLTSDGVPVCPSGFNYSWQVGGQPLPDTGCQVTATVPKLGVYDVKATELANGSPTGVVVKNSRVVVRDWLIVGLGDSNGSGEGNPPFVFPQCDRSLASSQYRTAQYIEDHDPRSSVTFLFASCSGARTEHLWENNYAGILPKIPLGPPPPPLPPQIQQVEDRIGTRSVDAVIMSIGINDLAFGPLMTFCVEVETPLGPPIAGTPRGVPCESLGVRIHTDSDGSVSYEYDRHSSTTLADATKARLAKLPNNYALLGGFLGVLRPAATFITKYPDPTHDQNGSFCSAGEGPFPNFYSSTWEWIYGTEVGLNAAVDHSGWTPVTGIPEDFLTHGYCAPPDDGDWPGGEAELDLGNSDFVPLSTAVFKNAPFHNNPYGAFHATFDGQTINLNHTLPAVCTALYGNPGCDDIPPAP